MFAIANLIQHALTTVGGHGVSSRPYIQYYIKTSAFPGAYGSAAAIESKKAHGHLSAWPMLISLDRFGALGLAPVEPGRQSGAIGKRGHKNMCTDESQPKYQLRPAWH